MKKTPGRRIRSASTDKGSKDAILSAALVAFAQAGFEGASIPKIARMADVAAPLVHYYFRSKENLWRETVEHSLGRLCKDAVAIQAATRALPPLERLRALLQAYTAFAARFPDQFVMIVAESRADSDRFTWVQERYTNILLGIMIADLEEAQASGAVKRIDAGKLSLMMLGSMHLYFSMNAPRGVNADLGQIADEYIELMFDTYLNGIAPGRRNFAS